MSKIIEETALEICRELNIDSFSAIDTILLISIYLRAKTKRGFKSLKQEFPKDMVIRIRNGMRTNYYFERHTIPTNIGRVSVYNLNERCSNNEQLRVNQPMCK